MIYNGFESFYIHGKYVNACNDFVLLVSTWFMPLLFLITGISSYLSLKKRPWKDYLKERCSKLFVPLFFGVLLIVPIQTYYAEKFHNNYQGRYLEQYKLFFTKFTDLTGYSGGFTPAHLWFLLYLFIISLLALPVMLRLKVSNGRITSKINNPIKLILLFLIPFVSSAILDIGGKSLGQFTAFVMLGFIICKQSEIIDMIEKHRLLYLVLTLIFTTIFYFIYHTSGWKSGFTAIAIAFSAFRHLIMWVSILTILGYGKRYLNFSYNATAYFTQAAFPLYIFHQSWLVLIAYYIFKLTDIFVVQFVSILLLTFIASMLTYELLRRIPVMRFMFGIKR
jgi:surface polysaccharide O-acyltransferase-like enzyme